MRRRVQFLANNSNETDASDGSPSTPEASHRLPVLLDPQAVADRFGAERHPVAFVLDEKRVIRYQRIDDQFGIGFVRPSPSRRPGRALDDILAGKEARVKTTPVAGCYITAPPALVLSPASSTTSSKVAGGGGTSARLRARRLARSADAAPGHEDVLFLVKSDLATRRSGGLYIAGSGPGYQACSTTAA
ncbi:MAG: hypothetical protein U0793_18455 [Gemmataceae bacterium]